MGYKQWSKSEARSAMAELSRSGASVAQFARDKGVSKQRVLYWKKRVGETTPAFVAVQMPQLSPLTFAGKAHIEVAIDGLVVRVREELDVDHLARIVAALSSRKC